MKTQVKFTEKQSAMALELLWDTLKVDPEYREHRRRTGWGTKTQQGLITCLERIAYEGE